MTSGLNYSTNLQPPYSLPKQGFTAVQDPSDYLMFQQVAAFECASVPLEDKMEAVHRILASMTGDQNQDGLNIGNYDYQEGVSPQGPPATSSCLTVDRYPYSGVMFAYLSTPLYRGIKPIPSLYLKVAFGSLKFTITLDGGATVSFVSAKLVYSLGVPIGPNHQLARLADSRFSIYSLGEVDF